MRKGAIDMGVTGSDLVGESGVQLTRASARVSASAGCRLCAGRSAYSTPEDFAGCRVATSFPRITESDFARSRASTWYRCPVP